VHAAELPGGGGHCQQHHASRQHLDGRGEQRVARHREPVAQHRPEAPGGRRAEHDAGIESRLRDADGLIAFRGASLGGCNVRTAL